MTEYFTSLPNELLALILVDLDRYSLLGIILSCKLIYERCCSQELADMIIQKREIFIPKCRLLVAYDYRNVIPQNYIPVYMPDKTHMLLVEDELQDRIPRISDYSYYILDIEVMTTKTIKFIELGYVLLNNGRLWLNSSKNDIYPLITIKNRNKEWIDSVSVEHGDSNVISILDQIIKGNYKIISITVTVK
jgi:hypothetical protein